MVEWGYSEEEGEAEEDEEEGGRKRVNVYRGEQNWIKKKCIVEERGGGGRKYLKKNVWWGGRGGGGGPSPLVNRGTVMVEWGYSDEEKEAELEEDALLLLS